MAGTSSTDLLDVWERSTGLAHPERAVVYATAGMRDRRADDVRELPIGRRDAGVARLRVATFGRQLAATASCPRCAEVVEFEVDVAELLPAHGELAPLRIEVKRGEWRIACRLLTTVDLLEARRSGGGVASVIARCVEATSRGGAPAAADELPAHLIEAIGDELASADPGADIRLRLTCVACSFAWAASFDIVSIVDRELDAWARATLRDVATLARAFGWSEAEALALSPSRRRWYLELAAG